ncbi:hypothetical protein DJ031_15335 [bacterium endosymbiont of Escarpia laminata]|nr:MAG: hypothetical protein DJ031_15335 [bacterium endosymbiont of Escarpia laminata]
MSKYYLRVEGINFNSFVLDTNRIKAIRGGSLMLLNSVGWLEEQITELDCITAGASWGLFSFEAENACQAGKMLDSVRRSFNGDERYKHTTMALAVLPAGDEKDYPKTRARLETLSRWQQMQSPAVAIPSVPKGETVFGTCTMDKLRPATQINYLRREGDEDKEEHVSASCRVRWVEDAKERKPKKEDVVVQRKSFYEKRTHITGLKFTEDLHQLSQGKEYGNLHEKMAVIYLDGNHFGNLARDYCTTEERQRRFDKKLRRQFQNGALTTLLNKIKDDPEWKNGDRIRLETLLWGGDEIIWVVPAWQGWRMLGRFFQITKDWEIGDKKLTHGAGLVYCHCTAPIQPIIGLVKELGEMAKGDRQSNRVAYQVLESFDHTGADLEKVRESRWPLTDKGAMILPGDTMLEADDAVKAIKQTDLPKRQLYRIAQTAFGDIEKAEQIADQLKTDEIQPYWSTLEQGLGEGLPAWLHLLELWNYLGLEKEGLS